MSCFNLSTANSRPPRSIRTCLFSARQELAWSCTTKKTKEKHDQQELFCFVCIQTGNLPTVVWGRRGAPRHFLFVCSISRSWRCHWCWWLSLKSNKLGRLSPHRNFGWFGWFGWPRIKSLKSHGEKFGGSHVPHFSSWWDFTARLLWALRPLET